MFKTPASGFSLGVVRRRVEKSPLPSTDLAAPDCCTVWFTRRNRLAHAAPKPSGNGRLDRLNGRHHGRGDAGPDRAAVGLYFASECRERWRQRRDDDCICIE